MVTPEIRRDVHVHDVPVPKLSPIGDAVANTLVNRCAHAFGKVVVVQGRGISVPLDGGLVRLSGGGGEGEGVPD